MPFLSSSVPAAGPHSLPFLVQAPQDSMEDYRKAFLARIRTLWSENSGTPAGTPSAGADSEEVAVPRRGQPSDRAPCDGGACPPPALASFPPATGVVTCSMCIAGDDLGAISHEGAHRPAGARPQRP